MVDKKVPYAGDDGAGTGGDGDHLLLGGEEQLAVDDADA
jgi:hypothetical protein